MGRVTENRHIVMTEVLSTVQDLYRKLSSERGGAEWSGALAPIHTCKVVCSHQGLRTVTTAMARAESLVASDFCEQHLRDLLRALDEVIGDLRPRVHGAPTIPSGVINRAALSTKAHSPGR